jgi:hypothetical protein
MSRDSAMGGFGFDGFAVRRHEDRCHQTQAAEVLNNGVGLHNAIIVFQADVSSGPFQVGRHDVVNELVLVDQIFCVELILKFILEYLLEDILETAILGFQNYVLWR